MTVDRYADSTPCPPDQPVRPRRTGDRPAPCTASLDPDLTITAADTDFYTRFDRASSEVCGHSLYDLLHPSAPALLGHHFTRLSQGRSARFTKHIRAMRTPHHVFCGHLTCTAVRPPRGPASYIVILAPDHHSCPDPGRPHPHARLSPMGAHILEGIAAGASTDQLASRLCLSRQGVVYHIGCMMRSLEAPNRAALVARAVSLGMLTVGTWPPRALPEFVNETGRRPGRVSEGSPS